MGQSLRVQWGKGGAALDGDHLRLLCALGEARFSLSLPRSVARQLGDMPEIFAGSEGVFAGKPCSHSARPASGVELGDMPEIFGGSEGVFAGKPCSHSARPASGVESGGDPGSHSARSASGVEPWEQGLPAKGPEHSPQRPSPVDLATSLLIEYTWLPLLESLETMLQQPLRILPSAAFEAPLRLDLSLRLGDHAEQSACLVMDANSATLILDVLDRCCPRAPQAFDTLPIAAQLNAGDAPLSLAEWQSLHPGDVVMLDQPADAHPTLVIGTRLQASAQIDGSRLRLRQPLATVPFPVNRNHPMSSHEATDGTLDSLPLTLTCQLGSYELTLAQLREMGAGSVLPLTTDSDRVELMINGRRVGLGELVRIGSGLGVRLLSLANP